MPTKEEKKGKVKRFPRLPAFGERLRALRDEKSLSQIELSTETGLSQSFISRIESGAAKPTRDVLANLAHRFGISLEELVKGTNIESVLGLPEFAQRYVYCPNVECPATRYTWWDDNSGHLVSRTVGELSEYRDWRLHGGGYATWEDRYVDGDMEGLYSEHLDLAPRQLLEKLPYVEVEFRWVSLDEKTKFCEHCGSTLRNTCPHCDVPLKMRNQKFCHACGRRLNRPVEEKGGGEK